MFIKLEITPKNEFKIETSGHLTISDAFLMLANGSLQFARQAMTHAPKGEEEKIKSTMYDMMNLRFSAVLENFAPEYELRPGLTAEAIMKAENELLQDEMSKVQK
jgi:hypothetical protein